jgi:hypothetical protein
MNSSSRWRGVRRAVAIVGDRHAGDQLHDEVGAAGVGGASVQDPGDMGMVHHRQRLALGLEPGDHLGGIHAGLDGFERHLASDRPGLLGHVDGAHPALAQALEELVGADRGARALDGAAGRRGRDDVGQRAGGCSRTAGRLAVLRARRDVLVPHACSSHEVRSDGRTESTDRCRCRVTSWTGSAWSPSRPNASCDGFATIAVSEAVIPRRPRSNRTTRSRIGRLGARVDRVRTSPDKP